MQQSPHKIFLLYKSSIQLSRIFNFIVQSHDKSNNSLFLVNVRSAEFLYSPYQTHQKEKLPNKRTCKNIKIPLKIVIGWKYSVSKYILKKNIYIQKICDTPCGTLQHTDWISQLFTIELM